MTSADAKNFRAWLNDEASLLPVSRVPTGGKEWEEYHEEQHRSRLLETARMADEMKARGDWEEKYGPIVPERVKSYQGTQLDAFGDLEFARGVAKFQAQQMEVQRGEERAQVQKRAWLMYSDEEKLAKGGENAGRRLRVQKWIKRMTAASVLHKQANACLGRKAGGTCVFCAKLHRDFVEALKLKKACPIPSGAERSQAKADEVRAERGEAKKQGAVKVKQVKLGGAGPANLKLSELSALRRSDLEKLEAPVSTSYKTYGEYLKSFQEYLSFRSQLTLEIERREAARAPKEKEAKVPKAKAEDRPKTEGQVAAQNIAKKAKKVRKDAARKQRRVQKQIEESKVQEALLKTKLNVTTLESKVAKANAKAAAQKKEAVPAVKREDKPGVRQESDEKAAKRHLVANQKKRLRKKRSKAAKNVADEK